MPIDEKKDPGSEPGVTRPLSEFKGDNLMIGCGHEKQHHFSYLSPPIASTSLHPSTQFYHVSLPSEYSDEGKHDLEGNFLDESVIKYLSQRKFDLICFEVVTEIFTQKNDRNKALDHAKSLLSDNGVCFVLFGGRGNLKAMHQAIGKFNYAYSFVYGFNQTWSIIASDTPFDLLELLQRHPYLQHMGEVIRRKSNLEIAYHFREAAINRHIDSSNPDDLALLEIMNPFARNKCITINAIMSSLTEEQDEKSKEEMKPSQRHRLR